MARWVYSLDANSESARPKLASLLAQLRSQGVVERVYVSIESGINGALALAKAAQKRR